MDWLKDRKNLPFVIAGACVLIIGSIIFVLFNMGVFTPSNPTPAAQTTASTGSPYPGAPGAAGYPGAPGTMGYPGSMGYPGAMGGPAMIPGPRGEAAASAAGMPGGAPTGVPSVPGLKTASAKKVTKPINPATANDPFQLPFFDEKKVLKSATKTILSSLPPLRNARPSNVMYSGTSAAAQVAKAEPSALPPLSPVGPASPFVVASLPRVSGILNGNGVYAIIQPAYGGAQSVKPGDMIPGVGSVTSIQPDGITVKSNSGTTIQIPVTAGPPSNGGYPGPGGPGGFPGGPPGGYGYGG
jgi:hypothetical protein